MPDYQRVASASEIPPGEMTVVEVNGVEVVIANIDGDFVCFNNSCTHKGGPMGEGMLLPGGVVECPFHGGQFNARTGEVVQSPPDTPLAIYPLKIEVDEISVAVEPSSQS